MNQSIEDVGKKDREQLLSSNNTARDTKSFGVAFLTTYLCQYYAIRNIIRKY